jgi:carbamoyltransferase
MGLASYGRPEFLESLRKIVRVDGQGRVVLDLTFFRHPHEGVQMTWDGGGPTVGALYSDKLVRLLGPAREPRSEITAQHENLAAALQTVFEECYFSLLNHAQRKTGLKAVCLAGGCAMNSVANGKIFAKTAFTNVYIQPAAGDAGTAIGAAFYVWNQILGQPRTFEMKSSYWGPEATGKEIEIAIEDLRKGSRPPSPPPSPETGEGAGRSPSPLPGQQELPRGRPPVERERGPALQFRTFQEEQELCRETAKLIADGKVIGWFQGRAEWGARALGNRSIVVDPRRAEMKDVLNERIKRREPFRPFAPSILAEAVGDFFEIAYPDPFMLKVYQVKTEKRSVIPAVTHVDGSGRLQTVHRDTNPRYWQLIKSFEELTGVPVVLNTSFNENEPIVNTPQEAIDCFVRTKMDVLVLGNHIVEKA